MKRETIIFENKNGEAVRVLNWRSKELFAVVNGDNGRLDFTDKTDGEQKILATIEKDELKKQPIKVGKYGQIRLITSEDDMSAPRGEVTPTEEDNRALPTYIRYSSIAHLGALGVILIS